MLKLAATLLLVGLVSSIENEIEGTADASEFQGSKLEYA